VTVSATSGSGYATIEVRDRGPGIPETEQSPVNREAQITQLTHSQGAGLWFVRWVTDALDGEFDIDATPEGTTVRLQVPHSDYCRSIPDRPHDVERSYRYIATIITIRLGPDRQTSPRNRSGERHSDRRPKDR